MVTSHGRNREELAMEALERSIGAEHCCWNPPGHSKASVNVGSGVYWLGRALAGRAPHLPAKYHVPTQDGEREMEMRAEPHYE